MYTLTCKALGVDTCGYQAEGSTKEDVISKMKTHADASHPGDPGHADPEKMEDAIEQS